MENKSVTEFTLSFLIITALCVDAAIIERILVFTAKNMKWADARSYCQKNYIDMITWNAVVEPWLASWLEQSGVEEVWIGLHRDPENSTVWKWINVKTGIGISGDDLSQSTYWADGEQSNVCAYVQVNNFWYSDQCSNSHKVHCSQGSKIISYQLSSTWYEASLYCQALNSNLAIITDENPKDIKQCGWIGLYQDTATSWKWIGNQPLTFSKWANGQPVSPPDCVSFKVASQKWYSNSCSDELQLVCYDDNLVLVKENKTWEEALGHCEGLITACHSSSGPCIYRHQLLSLQDLNDFSYARDRIYTATTDEIWMGLRFLGGHWWWINGQELDDDGILADCPSQQKNCGTLSKYGTDTWTGRDCTERKNFVCLREMIHIDQT